MRTVQKAIDFAKKAHDGQYRKYTGEPYIKHPLEVASLLVQHSPEADEDAIAAAILHDVVEDTSVSLYEIKATFGLIVGNLVEELTDVSRPEDGNRKIRKEIDRQHTAKASFRGQTIKLCDMISNTSSIVEHDKEFAKTYLEEKRELLKIMSPSVKQTRLYVKALLLLESCTVDLEHWHEQKAKEKVQPE